MYLDQEGLAQLVIELIRNARAALPAAGGQIVVETGFHRHDQHGYACLRVCDNGRGMPAEVLARATEPLFTTHPQGIKTGWGLSKCFGFVHQSGGLEHFAV